MRYFQVYFFKNIIFAFASIFFISLTFMSSAWSQCSSSSKVLVDGETFVVPLGVTSITIEVRGAAGGNGIGDNFSGGGGATLIADFMVNPQDELLAIIGVAGSNANGNGAGGGGGSAVINSSISQVLSIAGAGSGGTASIAGGPGGSNLIMGDGIQGGSGGEGGGSGGGRGGGGGGYLEDGNRAIPGLQGTLTSGGNGGNGKGANGGYGFGGGGGGSISTFGSGGGGGFNGGDGGGGSTGEGGDSFYNINSISGTPIHSPGGNSGDGYVLICWEAAPLIPTMTQWALLILGLILSSFAVVYIRRTKLAV